MIKQCGDDPKVGALLITVAGNAFCAGGDIKGMGNNSSKAEVAFDEHVADLRTKQRTYGYARGGGEADDRSAAGACARSRARDRARQRYPHCLRIRDYGHWICPYRVDGGLRDRVVADAACGHVAGAGADVSCRSASTHAAAKR
jgi:hypothetical protein